MNDNELVTAAGNKTILCIGAHPDDCEVHCGGSAARWTRAGNRVVMVSVTDGRSGHHQMEPEALAERRQREAANAASIIGAESRILDNPDGGLEPTLDNRLEIIRLVREIRPDIIITNRPNDYHPDHRYTSQLVQDSAYSFMVPHIAPEVDALRYNPAIFYWVDSFTYPRPFKPTIAIGIDSVLEDKLAMMNEHASQFYEWLPWINRYPDPVPEEAGARMEWLKMVYRQYSVPSVADRFRELLVDRYGDAAGSRVVEAEAFELCEYGTRPGTAMLGDLFEEFG